MSLFDPTHLLTAYGYLGVFVVVFVESGIFFALPGDSLLFTAGLLAATVGFKLSLLIGIIFAAGFLGSLAGYLIGIYIEHLHEFAFWRKILKREYLDEAHTFFAEHGKAAIILGRFIPVVRTFVPIVAGAARMRLGSFARYSLVSSLLWSTIVTLLGFYLGQAFPQIKDYLSYFILIIIVVSVLPGLVGWHRKRSSHQGTK